jgi:hypothetical protein
MLVKLSIFIQTKKKMEAEILLPAEEQWAERFDRAAKE